MPNWWLPLPKNSSSQLHGVGSAKKPICAGNWGRRQVLEFFGKVEPTKVGLDVAERALLATRVGRFDTPSRSALPPQHVKPYVKRGKNAAADAEAILEATSRPTMWFVPVNMTEQQTDFNAGGHVGLAH